MSDHNNIYNIMGKLNALTPAQQAPKETTQRIYESVEAKGSVLEGVKAVEATLSEKYMGFKKTVAAIKKGGSAENPEAVAASIGRKKYGKTAFQKAAAAGKKMGEGQEIYEEMCDECGMYESHCSCDHEHMDEERETLKTKKGTIYKGGKYGTDYDAGEDGEKKKTKAKDKDGEKKGRGRPKKEEPAKIDAPKGDIFGRTTGDVPKGKKGTVVKGKGNQDTVDESTFKKHYRKVLEAKGIKVTEQMLEEGWKSKLATLGTAAALGATALGGMMGTQAGVNQQGAEYGAAHGGGGVGGSSFSQLNRAQSQEDAKADAFAKASPQFKQELQQLRQQIDQKYGDSPMLQMQKQLEGTKALLAKYQANESVVESTRKIGKALMESVNFKKMMDECNMTADEMLECINQDIQAYKATGDMTNRLRDFMHLHNHMKKVEMESAPQGAEFAPQMPSGQDVLPQQSTLGKIGSTVKKAFTGPDDAELLARLQQDTKPTTVDEELNELAKLAGITNEGTCPECGHDPCSCDEVEEGNEFSGELAKARAQHKDHFEVDGETYPVKENTNLEDIAKLAGIFQEGKDYGDTDFNEPPTYNNTPDEEVMGVEVLTKGGDGEVAGMEKKMHNDKPTFKNGDNALSETKEIIKPAAEFNFVKEMGRDLMKAYEGIKTK